MDNKNGNPDPKRYNKPQMPRSPWFYVMIVIMGILLISSVVSARNMFGRSVETAEYSDFISLVDSGQVAEVQIGAEVITFTLKTDSTLPRWFFDGSSAKTYQTVTVQDPYLVDRLLRAGVKFGGESSGGISFMSLLISVILPVAFYGVIIFMIVRMLRKGGAGGMGAMSFGKSSAKMYTLSDESKKFTDVAGQDEAKEQLIELVDFLHQPEKYRAIGAKLPKGALLVGPPGTGKTLLAQAVAGEAKVPFFFVSGSAFVEMFVGTGAARVRDLFKQATEKAPCIIFIDEIDAIGKKRDAVGLSSNDEREQALNQLLAEMDGFDASKGIVVLGATNRPEILDAALLRPGRFDRRITVDLPDLRGREAVLKVHARGITTDKSVDFTAIARSTVGASGADLANIVNESAVENVIAGTERKSFVIPEAEKRIVAYHEIGHALVSARQKNAVPVQKITIIPRTSGALGYTMQVDEEEHVLMKREDILAKLAVLTAGRAAEEYACNTCTTGASNDIEQARAGDKARPRHDHPLRHERKVRYGRAGNQRQPVPGRRRAAGLQRGDRQPDRRRSSKIDQRFLRQGAEHPQAEYQAAARPGRIPAGKGKYLRRGVPADPGPERTG